MRSTLESGWCAFTLTLASLTLLPLALATGGGGDAGPYFVTPIENVTVPVGREARLTCVVENLDTYMVAWIYKGTGGRTVLTMAGQVVTKNPRVSVAQEAQAWVLTIYQLTKKDEGIYMCQVNTKPARKQFGSIQVVVPPSIDDATSSGDVEVDEGGDVLLTCEARGDPHPHVRWLREDNQRFNLNDTQIVDDHMGRTLAIPRAHRNHTGAFLCIASNGVLPSVSKRIILSVNFAPTILHDYSAKRVGVSLEGQVSLDCTFQTRPLGEVRWTKGPRHLKPQSPFVTVNTTNQDKASGTWTSRLTIQVESTRDFGRYGCTVRNGLGQAELYFDVYEITTTTTTTTTTSTTTTTTTTTTIAPSLPHPSQTTTQPPFFPWKSPALETTTAVSQNRYVSGDGDALDNQQRQTKLSFGSYFDTPSSSCRSRWSSRVMGLSLMVVAWGSSSHTLTS